MSGLSESKSLYNFSRISFELDLLFVTSFFSSALVATTVVTAALIFLLSSVAGLLAAGLLAKKAYEMGLKKKPYIKTSLSPGCGNITKHYLTKSGMLSYLEAFGFIFF